MKEKRTPLLLSVLALSALLFPGRVFQQTQEVQPGQAQSGELESISTSSTADRSGKQDEDEKNKPSPQGGWKEPIRLLQEFFGIPTEGVEIGKLSVVEKLTIGSGKQLDWHLSASQPASRQDLDQALTHIKNCNQGYNMEFMIVLVPDPLDSNLAESFDQVLDAVQRGYTESNYLLDSLWLPWTGTAAEEKTYRETPGLLLFRDAHTERRLMVVFLVGETPKRGIHKGALLTALAMIKGLRSHQEPVRILGPFFSGSADSLALALTLIPQPMLPGEGLLGSLGIPQGLTFEIITGSATGSGLEDKLGKPPRFERTVIPDDILQNMALTFLHERLGWNEREVALLSESDTAYGRTALQSRPHFTLTTFPSGVSDLRTAWEKDGRLRPSEDDKAPIKPRALTLDLKLADPTKPVDIVPEFSPLSLSTHDLEISNLLAAISRDEIRYLGIIATDVRDTLFLAKRIRQYAPDVILFTFSNHLLQAHPQFGGDTDGMLVISNFPLFTEGTASRGLLGAADDRNHPFRRQFASDFQEGIFRATQKLLRVKSASQYGDTRGWVAAVGNGALWPIADLPVATTDMPPSLLGSFPLSRPNAHLQFEPPSRKSKLQTSLLLLSLLVFAWMLYRTAPPLGLDKATRCLLLLGYSLLVLSAEVLLLACTIRWWHTWELSRLYLPFAVVGALYAVQIWIRRSRLSREWTPMLTALGILVLLLPAIAWSLDRLWMPGGAEYFDFRVRKLSSGLSPLVSLGYFAAAIYIWTFLELKRRKLILRQVIPWPLQHPCENLLLDCRTLSRELDKRLRRTIPPLLSSRFWGVLGFGIVPTGIYLMLTLQPICETRAYGLIFLSLILLCFTLSAISFAQFLKLWLLLDSRLLRRLDHSSLIDSFKRTSTQVGWEPMRSFGWQLPTFKMLTLSIEKLNAADQALRWSPSATTSDPTVALQRIFDADQRGDLGAEIGARETLDESFSDAYDRLAKHRDHPKVQDFFAVRIVAYVRPAVAHMRNCLMAALISGFFTLLAVRNYAFEPKKFVSVGIWATMIGAVVVTLWVFVQMDRNPTLSAIGGTDPGKVSFDRNFFLNVSTYGLIPLLGLIVSQFPQIGRFVGAWFNPLLRVLGAG